MGFVNLTVPATAGVGASADISAIGKDKTIIIAGSFTGIIVPEVSQDGTIWAALGSFQGSDVVFDELVARFMRIRGVGANFSGAGASADVGAPNKANQFGQILMPAADGAGAALAASALGSFNTFELGGVDPFEGTITVQGRGSPTGAFVPIVSFSRGGIQTVPNLVVESLRVFARGFSSPIPAALRLDVGAQDD